MPGSLTDSGKSRDELLGELPCRNKKKQAKALTPEEKEVEDRDQEFLAKITEGDVDVVRQMINGGQPVNVGDETGESAVHKACRLAATEMLQLLIDSGAFVDYSDSYSKRPVVVALETSNEPLLSLLLAQRDGKGGRMVVLDMVHPVDGKTLLHEVAWVGFTEGAKTLIKHMTSEFAEEQLKGEDGLFEKTNKQGQTPMHIAAFRSPKDLVAEFVSSGFEMNVVEKNGRRLSKDTPEQMAAAMGRQDTADFLKSLMVTTTAVGFAAKMKVRANATATA